MIFHPSKREAIHFPKCFSTTGHRMATRGSHTLDRGLRMLTKNARCFRQGGFLFPGSRGLDKKRSHFPLNINKTGAQTEHAHSGKQGRQKILFRLSLNHFYIQTTLPLCRQQTICFFIRTFTDLLNLSFLTQKYNFMLSRQLPPLLINNKQTCIFNYLKSRYNTKSTRFHNPC